MKLQMSFRILRLMLPLARWALKNIEKKKVHSVHETEQMETLRRFIATMKW